MIALNKLEKEVLDISYENKSSHIGSCLCAVVLIDKLYKIKKKNEPFILSNGHAFLALAVILEKYEKQNARELVKEHGTHPTRNLKEGIYCSTGSLGQGLPIAVGMALANRKRNVYVMISDGECAEGSIWEALRIASELRLENLRVEVVANGYSAYGKIDVEWLDTRLVYFYPVLTLKVQSYMYKWPDWLQGINAHYVVMDEKMYKEATNG